MMIKQFFIILAALFFGYALSAGLNLPIPSNVLGFLLLFLALCLGIVKLKSIETICNFIIQYLSIFFVVPTVGIMLYFDLIGSQFMKIILPLMLSILIGYYVAAKSTEIMINMQNKRKQKMGGDFVGGADHE